MVWLSFEHNRRRYIYIYEYIYVYITLTANFRKLIVILKCFHYVSLDVNWQTAKAVKSPAISVLIHCDLVTPYGDIYLGWQWLGWWLDDWWHQWITWANIDRLSVKSSGILLRAILMGVFEISVTNMLQNYTVKMLAIFLRGRWFQ